jgi:hypothetical protein
MVVSFSFGSVENAVLGETRWFDPARCVREKYQSNVGDPWLERSDQDIVGGVALRRRRTVRHGWMRHKSDHGDPSGCILGIVWTEAREHSPVRRYRAEGFRRSGEVTGGHHHLIANQGSADECEQLQRLPGVIDLPDHDRPDV